MCIFRRPFAVAATWAATRYLLLFGVFRVLALPGPDVTSDVHVIYQGWSQVLATGTYPLDDVTWQYPPAAALAILSPRRCPSSTTRRRSSCSPSWRTRRSSAS